MSVASAGWFFTSDEEYIENCADDTILTILKNDVDWWRDYKIKVEDNISKYVVVPVENVNSSNEEIFYSIETRNIYHDLGTHLDGSLTLKNGNIITLSEVLENEMIYRNSRIHNFTKLSLQEKLLDYEYDKYIFYEKLFKDCAQTFKEDEITFKAKWK